LAKDINFQIVIGWRGQLEDCLIFTLPLVENKMVVVLGTRPHATYLSIKILGSAGLERPC
jgi:hypothetical protein